MAAATPALSEWPTIRPERHLMPQKASLKMVFTDLLARPASRADDGEIEWVLDRLEKPHARFWITAVRLNFF
jgi:hypothetical protein